MWVGSNIDDGVRTAVAQHDVIWLFEPIPEIAQTLRDEFFHSGKAVIVVEAAVFSDRRSRVLNLYNESGASSTLGEPTEFHQRSYPKVDWEKFGETEVRCVKLSDYLPIYLTTLIIDAQGCDLEILKSIEPWLAEGRILCICAEADGLESMHLGLPDNTAVSMIKYMSQFPYDCEQIGRLTCSPDIIWSLRDGLENAA